MKYDSLVSTCTHTNIHISVYRYIHIYVSVCIRMYVYMYLYVCMPYLASTSRHLHPHLSLVLCRLVALLSFGLHPGHVRQLLMKLYPWSVKSLAICSLCKAAALPRVSASIRIVAALNLLCATCSMCFCGTNDAACSPKTFSKTNFQNGKLFCLSCILKFEFFF